MEDPKIIPFIPNGCFWADEHQMIYMVRCPKCKKENYSPAVATGMCAWCGWDVNKGEYYKIGNENEVNKRTQT